MTPAETEIQVIKHSLQLGKGELELYQTWFSLLQMVGFV